MAGGSPLTPKHILVLDSLFDDLDVERLAASARGWDVLRWDGSAAQLAQADAVVHVCTRVARDLIAQLTQCPVLGRLGGGLDSVAQAAAAQPPIARVNLRNYILPATTART